MRDRDRQRTGRDLFTDVLPDGREVMRIYKDDTSDTNFERLTIGTDGTDFVFAVEAGPAGGTLRNMVVQVGGTAVATFNAGGLVGGASVDAGTSGKFVEGYVTEEITLSTVGATTDSTANMFPANAEILRCVWRVTETIDNRTAFIIGIKSGDDDGLVTTQSTLAAGTTGVGIGALTQAYNATGAKATVTTSGGTQNTTGKIRLTTFYRQYTVPSA